MTLIHMATQKPRRVLSMILVGATTYFPDQARDIMNRLPSEMSDEELAGGVRAAHADAQTADVLRRFREMSDGYDDMNFTEPYLGTIAARTLIVHGDRDEFLPVAIPAAMYEAIPNASLWIVPGAEHIPIFGEWGSVVQQQALAFLELRN